MIRSGTKASDGAGLDLDHTGLIQKQNILIIDDEQGIRESLEEVFCDEFNVFLAKDGKEGLDLFKSLPIDLILLDLFLPGMDGIQVLKHIRRESSRPVPVLVITGYSTLEWSETCADLEVQGYIKKPFDVPDLLERVRGKLGNPPNYAPPGGLSDVVEEAVRYIHGHYRKAKRVSDVAAWVGVSRRYLSKKFKEEIGCTVKEYINRFRTKKAQQLLLERRNVKLARIWHRSGFSSESQFLRNFRRDSGMSPEAFRKSHR